MSEQSLLEDIETTSITPDFRSYRAFLDERSPVDVDLSTKFYEIIDSASGLCKSDLLQSCRQTAWFIRNQTTGRVRLATKQCRLRWCYHCGEARQQFITQAVSGWFNHASDPKLLTVTVKHSGDPLPEQIDFLYRSFVRLRARQLLKNKIQGGIWFFQVTYNSRTNTWHPHIHALLDADYMSHNYLKTLWEKITNGSTIVHIRRVDDPDRSLSHNARYAARPSSLRTIPETKWPELFEAFNKRRICGTWGTAKSISLRAKKPNDSGDWKSIGGFKTVRALMDTDDDARAIWRAWTMDEELDQDISLQSVEDFFEDSKPQPPPPLYEWDIQPNFDWEHSN